MQGNPVVHFEIYVDDIDRAKTFYQSLFGITLEATPLPTDDFPGEMEMWSFPMASEDAMNSYGSGGMLVKMTGMSPGSGGTVVYFSCHDCGQQVEKVEALGGAVVQPKTAIGEQGFCALVQDTEGNVIGLHSMV